MMIRDVQFQLESMFDRNRQVCFCQRLRGCIHLPLVIFPLMPLLLVRIKVAIRPVLIVRLSLRRITFEWFLPMLSKRLQSIGKLSL
jgi:hypothetical protein